VRNRTSVPILRGISIAILSIALVLAVVALIGYSRQRNSYPRGMKIAGVPVGGVNPQIASERVLQVYSSPIEVQYSESIIHVDPSTGNPGAPRLSSARPSLGGRLDFGPGRTNS